MPQPFDMHSHWLSREWNAGAIQVVRNQLAERSIAHVPPTVIDRAGQLRAKRRTSPRLVAGRIILRLGEARDHYIRAGKVMRVVFGEAVYGDLEIDEQHRAILDITGCVEDSGIGLRPNETRKQRDRNRRPDLVGLHRHGAIVPNCCQSPAPIDAFTSSDGCNSGLHEKLGAELMCTPSVRLTDLSVSAAWIKKAAGARGSDTGNSRKNLAEKFAERRCRHATACLNTGELAGLAPPDLPRVRKVEFFADRWAEIGA